MSDINVVTLSGRLTRDPELRHTPSGTAVMSARLAFETSRKNGSEWVNEPNYVDLVAWGNRAEFYCDRLTKGSLVFVSGRLKWQEWETQSGDKRQKLEINVDEIKSEDLFGKGSTRQRDDFVPTAAVDDDIPF